MSRDGEAPESDGATPLDEDEMAALIPPSVTTQGDLNEWEQANIAEASRWLGSRRRSIEHVLSEKFLLDVHRRMFDQTWEWAGSFRRSEKNIGVPWTTVRATIRELLADTAHQIESRSTAHDDIAARFHHRLVVIHPFPNGNGRHARLMTDELLKCLDRPPFSWGLGTSDARERYLSALRAADNGDFRPMVAFVRS